MATRSAIQRQWNSFLKSEKARASAGRWAASAAILASASAAATAASGSGREDDSAEQHCSHASRGPVGALLSTTTRARRNQRAAAQCETWLPYRRSGHEESTDDGSAGGGGGGVAFGPWRSESSANARKALPPRRQNKRAGSEQRDAVHMSEKYSIDFDTVLGEGAYGRVHPARVVGTGERVALKKISKRYTSTASFRSETDALLRIYDNGGHPNILGLRDMYEDYGHYYLFLDLARGGEMFDHLIQHGQYSEFDASRLVTEILSALAFLHNIGVVHADLKPENLLLCSRTKGAETVKIIDFGCASVDKRGESLFSGGRGDADGEGWTKKSETESIGTKAYWSPERFRKDSTVSESVDLWALGVIVFIMLVGVHPFDIKGCSSDEEIYEEIQKRSGPPMHLASHLSPSARDLIKKLMERDSNKRLTAIAALQHPWIRGDTPTSNIIEGSDTKLHMYQNLRDKLASGIFAALVDGDNLRNKISDNENKEQQSLTHLLKRAFEVFDEEGKGFVNEADLGRVMTKVTGASLSPAESKDMMTAAKKTRSMAHPSSGLSLSDFSQLFSKLSHQHYKRGDYIYNPGDDGDAMYFINSGRVEILTKKGHLVSILRHGDCFGEGSLLEDRNHRITAARCSTPVDVIRISKEDFRRYLESSSTKRALKLKWKARRLAQAKQLLRLQTNLTKRQLRRGETVYHEGDIGKKSMFLVEEGTLQVKHGEETLYTLSSGDSFGESSLLFQRPRSSTVVCASAGCSLHEMSGVDFLALLESDPAHARALSDMCRKRMFHKAVKSYLLSQNSALGEEELAKAFHDVDKDKSGDLSLSEVRDLMLHMGKNSAIPEKDMRELLKSLDLDEDGQVSLNDILEMSKAFK